ncbi:YesL family protein [Jeotgalibacillus proteolyticus]|uniref:DUF624 domain-containing protein n=1 Tax=Jeotgalibacillus proteolyticus TaxID=2082395 RepID=A0A2S5GB57_9BACL|nr:DUF624 domain-containing protein [Jeotgalibacillus proteolyticus]PPA70229.1 hypothetical protein C4B60_11650 [Jeotgalibacillus proteolyticus]
MQEGVIGGFYRVCEWIMRLAFVNILWIGFTLLGAVFLGIMPATVALFTVIRQWLMKREGVPVYALFWRTYKSEWLKSNKLGVLIYLGSLLLYLDFRFVFSVQGEMQMLLLIPFIVLLLLFMLILLYIFPVYVHFELPVGRLLHHAFLIAFAQPFCTFFMMVSTGAFAVVYIIIPTLAPFFGAVSIAVCLMASGMYGFQRVVNRRAVAGQ